MDHQDGGLKVTIPPSPAQQRVRELTREVRLNFPKVHSGYGFPVPAALTALNAKLSQDPIIQRDPDLSWELSQPRHSTHYLQQLPTLPPVRDHLNFTPQDFQPYWASRGPLHQGDLDKNPQVTHWVLLGLDEGAQISGADFSAAFCPETGLIFSLSGGVHRLYAHLLWGVQGFDLPGAAFHPLAEPFNAALDQAWLTLERDLPNFFERSRAWPVTSQEAVTTFTTWTSQPATWAALRSLDLHHPFWAWHGQGWDEALRFTEEVHAAVSGRRASREVTARLKEAGVLRRSWWERPRWPWLER